MDNDAFISALLLVDLQRLLKSTGTGVLMLSVINTLLYNLQSVLEL